MKKVLRILTITLIGFLCLFSGIIYSRYARDGFAGIMTLRNLLSQSVETEGESMPISNLTKEQRTKRILQIEKEIVEETNDPERVIQLRTELYNLRLEESKNP